MKNKVKLQKLQPVGQKLIRRVSILYLSCVELYSKKLPTYVVRSRQKMKAPIHFMIKKVPLEPISENSPKGLCIELSRDDDPLFLYTTSIFEDDFQHIKEQQNLLISFDAFPNKLIELLECALFEDSKPEPKYVLNFYCTSSDFPHWNGTRKSEFQAMIEIAESNQFKHLIHLTLTFEVANQNLLQKHLCSLVSSLKKEKCRVNEHIFELETQLNKQKLRNDEIVASHGKEIVELEEKFQIEKDELRRNQQEERRCLQEKLQDVSSTNEELRKNLRLVEVKLKEAQQREEQNTQEMQRLKMSLQNSDREVVELEKMRNQLETHLRIVEEDVSEKEAELERWDNNFKELLSRNMNLEETLQQQRTAFDALRQRYDDQCEQTKKGVEIIRKIKDGSAFFKKKATATANIVRQQERELQTTKSLIDDIKADQVKMREKNEMLQKKLEEKEEEIKKLQESVTDYQGQLQAKEDMIRLLNRNFMNVASGRSLNTMHNTGISNLPYTPVLDAPISTLRSNVNMKGQDRNPHLDPKYLEPNVPELPKTQNNPL
ncbi:Spindle assembly abnormal protein 6 -like protein [Trichinella papuae]|uniref:Spindle assembly abnormal protein 6-like protein n=1 Tax=Trichinella papuae TaxID=268474 RepID=A0A0V1N2W5_9BILA|nr:Spindle assembly abnormal protein 6 -like protein [Trichinella papuae]